MKFTQMTKHKHMHASVIFPDVGIDIYAVSVDTNVLTLIYAIFIDNMLTRIFDR